MEITQYSKNGSAGFSEKKECPRAVVRDYLRAIGIPYARVDAVCKIIPQGIVGENFPEEDEVSLKAWPFEKDENGDWKPRTPNP